MRELKGALIRYNEAGNRGGSAVSEAMGDIMAIVRTGRIRA